MLGDGAYRWKRELGRDARALLDALRAHPGVIDAVVTETHAFVTFDPAKPPDAPWALEENVPKGSIPPQREHRVRARYDGPDLGEVASRLQVTREHVVHAHASRTYVVRLLGFMPGFAYLSALDPPLPMSRRSVPRPRVEAGSIGIAAGYTAIYPFASPGGWHLIATAVDFKAFDPQKGAAFALGDRVTFEVVR
jgi:UPF0271 protein